MTYDTRDHVAEARTYATTVASGERLACRWERLAAERYLADLERTDQEWRFDPVWAARACRFVELLPHVEGRWDTRTIRLAPVQCWWLCALFGFRYPDGRRRYTTVILSVARKNAKSTIAAAILLAVLCLEPEPGAQVISGATTGDQARIVWGIAQRMVQASPDLRRAYGLVPQARTVLQPRTGSVMRYINAKASTQDGLNPSAASLDEIHAHKTRDLFDVLRSAAGARRNPLWLYTTTEGYLNLGPWQELRHLARGVLQGSVQAGHVLALIYTLDVKVEEGEEPDDETDEATWVKANPLLGVSVSLQQLRDYYLEARHQPSALAEFRIKRLNLESQAARGWVNLRRWREGKGKVNLAKLEGLPCYGALDLMSTTDMVAWRLLWTLPDGGWATWGRFWAPREQAEARSERGRSEYETWAQQGWLTLTDGPVIDYDAVQQAVSEDVLRFYPAAVAYDPFNAAQLANNLVNEGVPMVKHRQTCVAYNPGMQALEVMYMGGGLRHEGSPVMDWQASNLVARHDRDGHMMPDRKTSADKIDGFAALVMAISAMLADDAGGFDAYLAHLKETRK